MLLHIVNNYKNKIYRELKHVEYKYKVIKTSQKFKNISLNCDLSQLYVYMWFELGVKCYTARIC